MMVQFSVFFTLNHTMARTIVNLFFSDVALCVAIRYDGNAAIDDGMGVETMAKVILKRERKKRLEQGHPWIFQSEVDRIEGDAAPGDFVDVYNHQGYWLAKGYINPASQITSAS